MTNIPKLSEETILRQADLEDGGCITAGRAIFFRPINDGLTPLGRAIAYADGKSPLPITPSETHSEESLARKAG
jgi:hypothetical protein